MKQYLGLMADGTHLDVWGIDAPVLGLAIVEMPPCDCGADLYGVMHVRSGSGLFFSHSPENFGANVWRVLSTVDWTRPATEIERDPLAPMAVKAAFRMVLDAFYGEPTTVVDDVPAYEDLLESAPERDRYRDLVPNNES